MSRKPLRIALVVAGLLAATTATAFAFDGYGLVGAVLTLAGFPLC